MTTPRDTRSSAASTREAGSLLPTGRRPSAMACRSRSASQPERPPAGASAMSSCKKSEPEVMDRLSGCDLALLTEPLWHQSRRVDTADPKDGP
ncbi:hypothetical protein GCM10009677_52460 [Sphaerisporangium rubeum]